MEARRAAHASQYVPSESCRLRLYRPDSQHQSTRQAKAGEYFICQENIGGTRILMRLQDSDKSEENAPGTVVVEQLAATVDGKRNKTRVECIVDDSPLRRHLISLRRSNSTAPSAAAPVGIGMPTGANRGIVHQQNVQAISHLCIRLR